MNIFPSSVIFSRRFLLLVMSIKYLLCVTEQTALQIRWVSLFSSVCKTGEGTVHPWSHPWAVWDVLEGHGQEPSWDLQPFGTHRVTHNEHLHCKMQLKRMDQNNNEECNKTPPLCGV